MEGCDIPLSKHPVELIWLSSKAEAELLAFVIPDFADINRRDLRAEGDRPPRQLTPKPTMPSFSPPSSRPSGSYSLKLLGLS